MEVSEEEVQSVELDNWAGYVEDTLADVLWARLDLCEWFKYEGYP